MSFGKLLAAGKSIINGRGAKAYRENKHVYLPKFEPVRNPFAKGVPAKTIPAPSAPASGVAAPKVAAANVFAPARPVPVAAPAKSVVPAGTASGPAKWAARLNPISMFRGAAESPVRPVAAVQTELSLDTVKVIHNDLSDAEVEVVPIKSRPSAPVTAREGEAAESWQDMEAKVFGVNAV